MTAPLRVFYGHHKCATGWITNNVREIAFHLGLQHHIVHLPEHYEASGSLGGLVHDRGVEVLLYTNATQAQADTLPEHRGFHVVRDPRDMLVSAYFSHLHSHPTEKWPELVPHRERLQSLSKDEGLFAEIEFSGQYFDEMEAWDYEQEHVLELHMEDLSAEPLETYTRIARFFGWLDEGEAALAGVGQAAQKLTMRMNRLHYKGHWMMPGNWPLLPIPKRRMASMPESELARIVERMSFKRLSGGRKKGEENVKSHYRKGVPGDWKNHLTPGHVARFKKRYGELLIRLGYETDLDW